MHSFTKEAGRGSVMSSINPLRLQTSKGGEECWRNKGWCNALPHGRGEGACMFRGRVKQRRVCVITGAPLRRMLLGCCRGAAMTFILRKTNSFWPKSHTIMQWDQPAIHCPSIQIQASDLLSWFIHHWVQRKYEQWHLPSYKHRMENPSSTNKIGKAWGS